MKGPLLWLNIAIVTMNFCITIGPLPTPPKACLLLQTL